MVRSQSTGAEPNGDQAHRPREERVARVKRRSNPGEVSLPWGRQEGEIGFARTSFELPDLDHAGAGVAAAIPAVESRTCSGEPGSTGLVECSEEEVFDAFFHGPSLSRRRLCIFATILGALG